MGRHQLTAGDLQHELEVAIGLAHQAGEVIMSYYQTGLDVDEKDGGEPVTVADRAADDLIVRGLRAAFPQDGILTEESDDDLSRLERERVWIVDPLDGTTEFIKGTGDFSVQIALTLQGEPVLGVVYQPTEDLLYHAVRDGGAFCVESGQTRQLRVTIETDLANMCMAASRSHYSAFVRAARQALGIRKVQRVGSVGLKVGLLAQGACDLYVATTVAKEWDFCAPHALLLEAGGTLTNLCGERLVYNQAKVAECRGLIGSNGHIHAHLVDVLTSLMDEKKG
jgi:3'(2'), 5'-bisphosphate nucleotidase